MPASRFLRPVLLTCVALALTMVHEGGEVAAQPRRLRDRSEEEERGRYPAVPFKAGDVQSLFKEQLERARDLEFARSFLDHFAKKGIPDIGGFKLPPGLDPDDPELLAKVAPLLKDLGLTKKITEMSREELTELKGKLEAIVPGKEPPPFLPRETKVDASDSSASSGSGLPKFPEDRSPWLDEEQLSDMLRDWLENVDQTRLGEWLNESAAWQETVSAFQKQLQNLGADGPKGWSFDTGFLDVGLEKLQSFEPPTLPPISLPSFRIGRIPTPSFGRPGGGGGMSAPSGETLLWGVIALLALGVAWFALRHLQFSRGSLPAAALGPWPVDLQTIATRTQLRLAFEHLALLTLGPDAETWNHRRIAAGLARGEGDRHDAASLATLYEHARYVDGPEELTAADAAQARDSLGRLAHSRRPEAGQ